MKKIVLMLSLLMGSVVIMAISACSSDNDDEGNGDKSYYLTYGSFGMHSAYLDWDPHYHLGVSLTLEFGEGIPFGSRWSLECDQPWLKIHNSYGEVHTGRMDGTSLTVEENNNYDDRVANITLNVTNGTINSYNDAKVTISQYGYEHYLSSGHYFSFETNRSKATNTILEIFNISSEQVMEINWGDGTTNVINDIQTDKTSHHYNSNGTYTVKLRIARGRTLDRFNFVIRRNQGVEFIDNGSTSQAVDPSKNIDVSYKDDSGYSIRQY